MSTGITMASMSSYAILGCGSVGYAVAEELVDEGKDVLIVDVDESRVEALRDQDMNARTADIADEGVPEAVADRDVLLVQSTDSDANEAAIANVRERGDEQFVIARAADPVTADELREAGADAVINPSSVIADAALRALETGELEHKAGRLADVLDSTEERLAILANDNPGPDSIASAVALQAIAEARDIEADILYDGEIGHQEDRAFVNLIGVDLRARDSVEFDAYDTLALVDHAQSMKQGIDRPIDVLIDHNEPEEEYDAAFADVRSNVSSTSTILTKYVQEFDLNLDDTVATALLYGIRAETLDFKRDTTPADLTAASYLYPFADHDTL